MSLPYTCIATHTVIDNHDTFTLLDNNITTKMSFETYVSSGNTANACIFLKLITLTAFLTRFTSQIE